MKNFIFLLFLILLQPVNASDVFTGKVIKIYDGDTLTVLVEKKQIKIRLAEIDCPERRQPWGK